MRHLRKQIVKTLFWCIGPLLCLLLLATVAFAGLRFWLTTSTGQDYVKRRFKSIGIEIERFHISGFLPKRAQLEKVQILAELGQKRIETSSNQIELKWSVAKLFLAEVAISDLHFSDLRIALKPRKSAPSAGVGPAGPTLFAIPRSISIDSLMVDELEISKSGETKSGRVCGKVDLRAWTKILCAHIELLFTDNRAKNPLLPCQIDLFSDTQKTRLSALIDPQQWIDKVITPQLDHPIQIVGQCKSDDLKRFAFEDKQHLPMDLEIDWRAGQNRNVKNRAIASLNRCLPLQIKAKAELLSKELFDLLIPAISVKSALGTAEGRGEIENGQWRDCELQMQVHHPIELPQPLKSIPATKSTAKWSGPLDAPTITYSVLPFGQRPEDLASEYRLQLKHFRSDPTKWLFDLMLKDRPKPVAIDCSAQPPPAAGLRQVAEGYFRIEVDQGAQLELSLRGIMPSVSPIKKCSLGGFFHLKSQLNVPKQRSERASFALQSQIGEVLFDTSLIENAHLSLEGEACFADLDRNWKSLLAQTNSRWQFFCTKAQKRDQRATALSGEFQQIKNSAQFQLSAQNLTWSSLNNSFIEDFSTDGTFQIEPSDDSWSCALRQIETSIDGNRLKTSQPIKLFGAPNRWELANLHLQAGAGSIKADIKSEGSALCADLTASSVPLSLANSLFDTELQGQIDGQINLLSCPNAPHLTGQFQTKDAAFFQNGEFRPLDAHLSMCIDQKLTKIGLSTSFFKQPLLIEGHLPWYAVAQAPFFALPENDPRNLSLSLSGEIGPLVSLLLPPGQRVKGDMKIALQCQSEERVPKFKGTISIQNGEYIYEKARVHLRDIAGQFNADENLLSWNGIFARDAAGGELTWSGKASFWPHFSMQSSADLTKIAYTHADFVKGRISGTMQWLADSKENHLRGNLKLADAQIKIPDQIPTAMPVIAQGLRSHREVQSNNLWLTSFDIDMEIPPRVDISGRGLSSKWGGWLHVGGDSQDAHLEGVLKLNTGIFTFGGKQFNIVDSHIYLGDKKRSEASLQVIAEYPVEGATVRAIFRGRLKAPELIFESSPQLSLNDMLSRVLFDTSFNTINPLQAIQVADAALSVSGNRYAPIGQFKRNIKLDQISVQMPDPEQKKYVLQVGKYLKNGVLVGVKQNIDSEESDALAGTQVSVEKRLRKHLTMKIEVGFRSQSSVSLLWKRDY